MSTRKDVVLTRKYLVITRKYVVLTRKDLIITRKDLVITRKDLVIRHNWVEKILCVGSITSPYLKIDHEDNAGRSRFRSVFLNQGGER